MSEKNILEELLEQSRSVGHSFNQKVKNALLRKTVTKEDAYYEKLSALGKECEAISQDSRYPGQQEFLDEAVKTLQNALQHLLARNINNLQRQDTLLKACTIAAQIEAYQNVRGRTDKILAEVESYRKTMKKEMNDNGD